MGGGRLVGRVAVVTGAGGGIGRAEALALAAEGASIVVNDVADAAGVVEEIVAAGGAAVTSTHDVSSFAECGRLVTTAMDAFGRLDILVNNAGNHRMEAVERISEESWEDVLRVHVHGSFATMKHAVPIFRAQRSGVVVNTSSEEGLGGVGMIHYGVAKEAVVGMTRCAARELGRFGVRVNAIRPRAKGTRMVTTARAEMDRWAPLRAALGRYWVGDVGHTVGAEAGADCVAPLVVWLCTDAAAAVNGRTFFVSGDEVGLYAEPHVERAVMRPGGWTVDALEAVAADHLLAGVENHFACTELADLEL